METVTGFSASLIQSLGGDADKSVKYADMAITDMADNANKMGTDMSLIQNAYQGFAKQNYTMLDNLKLGYGGTKEEMQRLLSDAEKISGIKYDISSYADVVDAIHVMQESMDIAGTTAKEAEGTISGSVNALKSSVTNLVVGFGDAEGMSSDVSSVMNSLADDMKTALPTDFSIDGNIKNSVNTQGLNSSVGGLSLVLNIANFNNYSNDDISQLTNEIMETAGQFAKRKGMVFA
nr:MAG TPA: tail tape measure protein [Caudoviricetes sp.]